MKKIIFLIKESLEGGYEARALEAPIFTQADELKELKTSIKDAVTCHFEEYNRPRIIHLHFSKDEVITS